MPTLEEAIDLFERRRKAWLAEDLEAYLALWADDMTFQSPLHDEPLEGKAAFEVLMRTSAAAVRPVGFDIMSVAVQGDIVLAEWRITMEWRPEGRRVSYTGMSRSTIRDGLITDWREYWNVGDMEMD